MTAKKNQSIRIRQVRSVIGRPRSHRRVVESLGLGRINQEVVKPDDAAMRGMVAKIPHLVEIVEEGS